MYAYLQKYVRLRHSFGRVVRHPEHNSHPEWARSCFVFSRRSLAVLNASVQLAMLGLEVNEQQQRSCG